MARKKSSLLNIWMLSREYGDLVGAGGVKDVVEQLAKALAEKASSRVRVVLPLYGSMDPVKLGLKQVWDPQHKSRPLEYEVDMNYVLQERREGVKVWTLKRDNIVLLLLDSKRFSEKLAPYTYTEQEEKQDPSKQRGMGHVDYFSVNILLQKAALDLMMILGERPDVIHCHDGHTGVLPAIVSENPGYRAYFRKAGMLVTIHNAGLGYHQEVDDLPFAKAVTGLPDRVITNNCIDDAFDPFLAAADYSVLNTVSENYAVELQETAEDSRTGWLGHALAKRGVTLEGVTNGIDPDVLTPVNGEKLGLAASFDPGSDDVLKGKWDCKVHLLKRLNSTGEIAEGRQHGTLSNEPDLPLFSFIGRLSSQKGIGLLIESLQQMQGEGDDFQIVLLGTGDTQEEERLIELAEEKGNTGKVCFIQGYAPKLANEIYAAGDFFLIPSEYEPCGLTDFIAQLFGNIPIVHYVGGLEKVLDEQTGFVYHRQVADELTEVMRKAIKLYGSRPGRIREIQKTAVETIMKNHTWETVVSRYGELYKQAIIMRLK